MEKTLINKNRKYLITYLFVNILLFIFFSNNEFFPSKNINDYFTYFKSPVYYFSFLLILITIVLEGFFSSNIKYILIFFKIKNPLPGCRAFTKIAHFDPRIDYTELKTKYGILPQNPVEQNNEWYKLYKIYQNKNIVLNSHKNFLLVRDLYSISILLIIFLPIIYIFIVGNVNYFYYHLIILSIMAFLLNISARNYANRFVANVLTEYLNDK